MQEKIQQLKAMQAEMTDLGNVASALGWDQVTYMPSGGAEDRGNALATLSKIMHM